jgi:hypothetical protein
LPLKNIFFRQNRVFQKYAFSEVSPHTRNVKALPQRRIHIPDLIGEPPIPSLELSKNIIGSRAENHLIFKRAHLNTIANRLVRPGRGDVKKGLAFPL